MDDLKLIKYGREVVYWNEKGLLLLVCSILLLAIIITSSTTISRSFLLDTSKLAMKIASCIVVLCASYTNVFAFTPSVRKAVLRTRLNFVDPHSVVESSQSLLNELKPLENLQSFLTADEAVSIYSKIDKTGFIGFIATYIEVAIDFFRSVFAAAGIKNAYGPAIILFTLIGKRSLASKPSQPTYFNVFVLPSSSAYRPAHKTAACIEYENPKARAFAAKDSSQVRK